MLDNGEALILAAARAIADKHRQILTEPDTSRLGYVSAKYDTLQSSLTNTLISAQVWGDDPAAKWCLLGIDVYDKTRALLTAAKAIHPDTEPATDTPPVTTSTVQTHAGTRDG